MKPPNHGLPHRVTITDEYDGSESIETEENIGWSIA